MERAAETKATTQRGAAAQRTELDGGLGEREDLQGLLPEGVSLEAALELLNAAGLTLEEAVEAYERGELESRLQELGPDELAALPVAIEPSTEEQSPAGGRTTGELRMACSCGGGASCSCGGDKEEEEEEDDETFAGARRSSAAAQVAQIVARVAHRSARSLIVADAAGRLSSGQMRRSAFLARLETVVRSTAEAALAGSGRTARDCPYIEASLRYYGSKTSRQIESAIQRYAPDAAAARSSRGYLLAIQGRVHAAVDRWARTGEVTGVPRAVPTPLAARLSPGLAAARATRPVLRSGTDGTAALDASPQAIRSRLGRGRPLDGSVRSRMEASFGTTFSSVRVHTDASAAALSSELHARAFAVGDDVAFAAGRYAPGTPIGDALIAHELAHVLQQRGSRLAEGSRDGHGARNLEADADRSATSVAMSLWRSGFHGASELGREALPRLRSGLRLSRCKDERTETAPPTPTPAPTPAAPCKPTMKSFEAKKTGSVVMTDAWRSPVCELSFGEPTAAGITFKSEVDVPAGCTGTLEYVQLADFCFERRDAAGSTWTRFKADGFGLDNADPYPFGGSKRVTSAGTVTFETDDSPGVPATGKDRVNVKKSDFKMYLLWTPDAPAGSPRVGLGLAEWHWKATATKKARPTGVCKTDWSVTGIDAAGGTGSATTSVPSWTKTYPRDSPEEPGQC